MSPRSITRDLLREAPLLQRSDLVERAVRVAMAARLPGLPVVDDDRLVGLFGERELLAALFPAYLDALGGAGFVPRSLDAALELRDTCRHETVGQHMSTEPVAVPLDFSDTRVAETFLHHQTLIVPVVDDARRVHGVLTRSDFLRRVAERLFGA